MTGTTAALTVILASLAALALAAEPDLPRHQIVYAQHADAERKDYDIWWMCGDGTQRASLVVEPGHQIQLDVSPDGGQIVYTSRVDDQREVFLRPLGRGEAVNLTDHPADDAAPSWSPDGARIAFFSTRDAEKPDLYLLDLETRELERKTDNEWHDGTASWSPDGGTVLMTRFFPGDEAAGTSSRGEVIALDLETGEERQLTELGGYNGNPTFSPDGGRVAFHRTAEEGTEIWVMNADGTDQRAITDTFIDEYSPEWSPDGNWIAFSAGTGSDNHGTFDIWLMRPDGSDRRLINGAANTQAWQKWRRGEHYCR